jgi:2-iminobutanoate/2-iminopropanoate deaminase
MDRTIVSSEKAPAAVGPYSQAVIAGELVFTAGTLPLDRETGRVVGEDIVGQTEQVLANLAAVLEAAGSSLDKVLKTTVFLTDMDDFAAMNTVYAGFFASEPPARATVQVGALPKGSVVEIEAIALK